jgi:AP-3 complex subunit delta-1
VWILLSLTLPQSSELLVLLRRILTDLDVPRPSAPPAVVPSSYAGYDDDLTDGPGSFASSSSSHRAPRSLRLLEPFFFSYELNPVNPKAQGMVAAPEGLDLDAWIVPRATTKTGSSEWPEEEGGGEEAGGGELEVDEYGRPKCAEVEVADHDEGVSSGKKKKKGTKGKKGKGKTKMAREGEGEVDESERARVSERSFGQPGLRKPGAD